jgi:hypothetical protein
VETPHRCIVTPSCSHLSSSVGTHSQAVEVSYLTGSLLLRPPESRPGERRLRENLTTSRGDDNALAVSVAAPGIVKSLPHGYPVQGRPECVVIGYSVWWAYLASVKSLVPWVAIVEPKVIVLPKKSKFICLLVQYLNRKFQVKSEPSSIMAKVDKVQRSTLNE